MRVRQRTCDCNTWGCLTCMARFIQRAMRKKKKERTAERSVDLKTHRDWDRTSSKEDWYAD